MTKRLRWVVLWTNARDSEHKVSGTFRTEDEYMTHIGNNRTPGWETLPLRLIPGDDLRLSDVEA